MRNDFCLVKGYGVVDGLFWMPLGLPINGVWVVLWECGNGYLDIWEMFFTL